MARRVHRFTYLVQRKDSNRPLLPHQQRDVAAACEILALLRGLGYEQGEPILNSPPRTRPKGGVPLRRGDLGVVDLSFVHSGDLILQTTRPPLDDLGEGPRKQVERGHTDLEQRLFQVWRQYFRSCARSNVELTDAVAAQLDPEFATRREMVFRERTAAPYKRLRARDGRGWQPHAADPVVTAAFLLRVDRIWPEGPGLLGAFGMDGISTLVWAYRLGRDFSHLLEKPGFVMAEMEAKDAIPARCFDLRWASQWDIKVILRLSPLPEAGTVAPAAPSDG